MNIISSQLLLLFFVSLPLRISLMRVEQLLCLVFVCVFRLHRIQSLAFLSVEFLRIFHHIVCCFRR